MKTSLVVSVLFDEAGELVLAEAPRDETLGAGHAGGLVALGPA